MRQSHLCWPLLAALLSTTSLPSPSTAEQLMKLPPEMRLVRGTTDQGEASSNVSVGRVHADRLSDAILEDVKAKLLIYTGDTKQLDAVIVYSWDSPWFHEQKQPPNLILDYSAIIPSKSFVPSDENSTPSLCNDEGCLMVGYTYVADKSWQQDFELRSASTKFVPVSLGDGTKNTQMTIITISNKDDCDADGSTTKQGCKRRFTWRKFGLAVLPPSR